MRQKKSKALLYVAIVIAVFSIIFIATREVPVHIEHVEQPLENTLVK